jgi:hypothetical protein
MKRGHDDMDTSNEMDTATVDDLTFKRVRPNDALDLVTLQLDKILNYLEVDSSTRENSHALLSRIIESMQNTPLQENPIYYAGAVTWIIKRLSAQRSSSFFIGRIFAVCEKIDISGSKLSLKLFISVIIKIAHFLEIGQLIPSSETSLITNSLQKIEIMQDSLAKAHSLYTKIIMLLFKPKSMVDPEKHCEIMTYLWVFYCFARGKILKYL